MLNVQIKSPPRYWSARSIMETEPDLSIHGALWVDLTLGTT